MSCWRQWAYQKLDGVDSIASWHVLNGFPSNDKYKSIMRSGLGLHIAESECTNHLQETQTQTKNCGFIFLGYVH